MPTTNSKFLQQVHIPVLKICNGSKPCIGWAGPVEWFPTVHTLQTSFTREEKSERTFFFAYVAAGLAVSSVVLIEIARNLTNFMIAHHRHGSGYIVISAEIERGNDVYIIEDVFFVAYHATYNVLVMWMVFVAVLGNQLDDTSGLDFEIWIIWEASVMFSHIVTTSIACVKAYSIGKKIKPFWTKVLLSIFPFVGEMFDTFKDCSTAGIYAGKLPSAVACICIALVIIGTVLPNIFIYSKPGILTGLRHSYWPAFAAIEVEREEQQQQQQQAIEEAEGKKQPQKQQSFAQQTTMSWAKTKIQQVYCSLVSAAKEMTGPIRQYMMLYEDVCQITGGLIFTLASEFSFFVLIISGVSAARVLAALSLRPVILGLCAQNDIPWDGVSETDVSNAVLCTCACSLQKRCKAARSLLAETWQDKATQKAAIHALTKLFKDGQGKLAGKEFYDEKELFVRCVLRLHTDPHVKTSVEYALKVTTTDTERAKMIEAADATQQLSSKERIYWEFGLRGLRDCPEYSEMALDLVHARLQDETAGIRIGAMKVLETMSIECFPKDSLALIAQRVSCDGEGERSIAFNTLEAVVKKHPQDAGLMANLVAAQLSKTKVVELQVGIVKFLGKFGIHAKPHVDQLIPVMQESDIVFTEVVIGELLQVAPSNESSRSAIRNTMRNIISNGRSSGSTTLASIQFRIKALDVLVKLADGDIFSVVEVVEVVKNYVQEALTEPERVHAASTLIKFNEAAKAHAKLVVDLLDQVAEDSQIRLVRSMGAFRSAYKDVIPKLAELLDSAEGHQSSLRGAILLCLGSFGHLAGNSMKEVRAQLKSQDKDVRLAAVNACAAIGVNMDLCDEDIIKKACEDRNYMVRGAANEALFKMSTNKQSTCLSTHLKGLFDEDPSLADQVPAFLSRWGHLAVSRLIDKETCLSILERYCEDKPAEIGRRAAEALGRLCHHIPACSQALLNMVEREETQESSLKALGHLKQHATTIIPFILSHLKSAFSPQVLKACMNTLGAFGHWSRPHAEDMVTKLMDYVENKRVDVSVCVSALQVVSSLGPAVTRVREQILKVGQQANPRVQIAVATCMCKLGKEHKQTRSFLFELMQSQSSTDEVRSAAFEAMIELELMDPKDGLKYLDDSTSLVRCAVNLVGRNIEDEQLWNHLKLLYEKELGDGIQQTIVRVALKGSEQSKRLVRLEQLAEMMYTVEDWDKCKHIAIALAKKGKMNKGWKSKVYCNSEDAVQPLCALGKKEDKKAKDLLNAMFEGQRLPSDILLYCGVPEIGESIKDYQHYFSQWLRRKTLEAEPPNYGDHDTKVLQIIGAFGLSGGSILTDLACLLKSAVCQARQQAALAFAKLASYGSKDTNYFKEQLKNYTVDLKELLNDSEFLVRAAAVRAVAAFVRQDLMNASMVDVDKLLQVNDKEHRRALARSLVFLRSEKTIKRLLQNPDADIRNGAALGICEVDAESRQALELGLYNVGSLVETFADILANLTADVIPSTRAAAAYALGWHGAKSQKHAKRIAEMLIDVETIHGDLSNMPFEGICFSYASGDEDDGRDLRVKLCPNSLGWYYAQDIYSGLNSQKRVFTAKVAHAAEAALQHLGAANSAGALPVLDRLLDEGCPCPSDIRRLRAQLTESR